LELDIPLELVERIAHAIVEQLGQAQPATACVAKASLSNPHDEDTEYQLRALPKAGFLRLKEVLAIIPVSKSTWYQGIASGRYPKPTKKFGPRIAAWNIQDIQVLLEATTKLGTPSAVRG
jgi:predicted DNA-binding transcriptional regulator AlpA